MIPQHILDAHDLEQHPACFMPEPEQTPREQYASLWNAVVTAMAASSKHTVCEVLGGPAVTHDTTSIDLGFQVDRGGFELLEKQLRAGADAVAKWMRDNPNRVE